MIKVAALTSGKNVPSSRFRVRQHIEPLRNAGIDVYEFVPGIDKYAPIPGWSRTVSQKYIWPLYPFWQGVKLITRVPGVIGSWRAQITWLEREMLPGCLSLEPILKRPYVFDLDDAIWLTFPFGRLTVSKIVRNAEVIIAGNSYIAEWCSSYSQNIRIVPTAIDTERFMPRSCNNFQTNKRFTIGWTGTSGNFKYLYQIETSLERFLKNHDAELVVIAETPPKFSKIQPEKVKFFNWSPAIEAEILQQIDVGIMPLLSDEWALGKCSFKMLQYMAAGVPVVVSPVGMNAEVLAKGEVGLPACNGADWFDALDNLYKDRELCHKYGAAGRQVIEQCFSRDVISAEIAHIFKELIKGN